MKFNQFDQPREPMSDLGRIVFDQAADVARAQAAAVREGVIIGQREGERYRAALAAVAAAYDRAVATGRPMPTALVAACEMAKKALP